MHKILIANRGEIAVRIAHTCADAGYASVAIYGDPDADALHVRVADEAYALVGESLADTYLNVEKILDIARRSGADAVHPGYGFLAERAEFAQVVIDAGLTWVGPDPATITLLGDKVAAREIAKKVGAPLVPGSDGPVADADAAVEMAKKLGLPVAIKATYGGGGRGMRVVHHMDELEEAFESASREALATFGNGECFMERFLERPRHIEAQVIADKHGNIYTLGTRDCTLQRRNQKLIEEAPAPFLTDEQRDRILDSAIAICREADYTGVGTVEYLMSADGTISFLEVNTRIQVEHTVTEATTGIDMVLAQLQIAEGREVPMSESARPSGHAFEFRINAEDVGRGFLPSMGEIEEYDMPTGPGIRVDSGVHQDSFVTGIYDSMLAKVIVSGINRQHALRRARRALRELRISGIATVLPFHRAVLEEPAFIGTEGLDVYTQWIENEFATKIEADPQFKPVIPSAARTHFMIDVNGRNVKLGLPAALMRLLLTGGGAGFTLVDDAPPARPANELIAPQAGLVSKWLVDDGAEVDEGSEVAIIEAMKVETKIKAHRAGVIAHKVEAGVRVKLDELLATID